MKRRYAILLLFFACSSYGQQVPALLSIEGIGGNSYDNISPRVVSTPDGGFILSISTSSTTGPILCDTNHTSSIFMKYNADGTVLEWKKCFNNAYMFLFPAPDGNFIVGGYRTTPANANDYYISKIDALGNEIWIKYYGGSSEDELNDMMATSDGGYLMLGDSYSNDGDVGMHYGSPFSADLWVIKLDSSGNKIWGTVIGGTDDDYPMALADGPNGGCYVTGTTFSNDLDCVGNHGGKDVIAARLDDSGHVLWHRCLGGTATEGMYGWATSDYHGGILISVSAGSSDGDVHNHIGDMDYWVVSVDSGNNILWDKCYGGTASDAPNAIAKEIDGSIWIGGWTRSTDMQVYISYGNTDSWIIHVDSGGNFLSSRVLGASENDIATMICPIARGIVMCGGTYEYPGLIDSEFPSQYWGATDIFLTRLASWTTEVKPPTVRNEQLSVYPNPATEKVTVTLPGKTSCHIEISDVLGRNIYSGDVKEGNSILDVRSWPKGSYYLLATGVGARYCVRLGII